ncbi:GNAT family N-acetyltransferase [Nakamurella deserti]|uniref:GNAT family N-acetyltransferase n=1 Tax=Nakamurella deserti TaxID=2164074 RepID=UPI000DBE25BF|nr:GNAT family N-acetyltransferase [Nakamurella deserti]
MTQATGSARTLRKLTPGDFDRTMALGLEAFGDLPPGIPRPTAERVFAEGRDSWGVFDGERLLARVVGLRRASWWGGRELAMCGVAGVTVAAEHRGEGLLHDLFAALLSEAVDRGDVLSALYPTAPGIYRRNGYELISSYDLVELRTADLTTVRAPAGVGTRRATLDDMPVVRAVYDTWAAAQNGPLTRRGLTFAATDRELLDDVTAVTLAVDADGTVVGYLSWNRGTGYDDTAVIEVDDLIALTADGYRALWRMLGTFAPVAPHVRLWTSGDDTARLVLPAARWTPVDRRPYMLRILDVAAALAVVPGGTPAEMTFDVVGDGVAGTDGGYRVRRDADGTTATRVDAGSDRPTLTPNGLALLWTGSQNAASLRFAGLLTGPADTDTRLDLLALHRPRHVRDYF